MKSAATDRSGRTLNVLLWALQALLAILFMFAGVMKFVMSVEEMTRQIALPGWFLHFIGVAEILGAIGLVLPGILRIRTGLTPVSGSGAGSHHDRRHFGEFKDWATRICADDRGLWATSCICGI